MSSYGPPLYRTHPAVAEAVCANPACGCQGREFFIHPRCHPRSGVEVFMDKVAGTVNVRCRACKLPIVSFLMAENGPEVSLE